eukprot:293373-Chlamydomonas_euryale.AAC.2
MSAISSYFACEAFVREAWSGEYGWTIWPPLMAARAHPRARARPHLSSQRSHIPHTPSKRTDVGPAARPARPLDEPTPAARAPVSIFGHPLLARPCLRFSSRSNLCTVQL